MATLPGQRASFTWNLNQYNVAEDDETRAPHVRRMAEIIQRAPGFGFTVEQVTQNQLYPEAEVSKLLNQPLSNIDSDISESQAIAAVNQAVDTSDLQQLGTGSGVVYAYGYPCAPDRLKIGYTDNDPVQRVFQQITTSTPDKPALLLQLRTHDCKNLERAIHAVLDYRGVRVKGAGHEWFKCSRQDVIDIYAAIVQLTTGPEDVGTPAQEKELA